MNLNDIIRENVVTVDPNEPAGEAARTMNRERIGSVVVAENNQPAGIVTDRDLAMKVVGAERDPSEITVQEVMNEDVITASVDDGVAEMLRVLYKNEIRRMPVVEEDGTLAGIVTLDDLIVLLAGEMQDISGIIQAESPAYDIDYEIF